MLGALRAVLLRQPALRRRLVSVGKLIDNSGCVERREIGEIERFSVCFCGGASGSIVRGKRILVCGVWGIGALMKLLAKRSTGARGMPRREQARKDAASCEKLGGAARGL